MPPCRKSLRGNRSKGRNLRGLNRKFDQKMVGAWVKCPNDPPPTNPSPWNQYTLVTGFYAEKAGWQTLTTASIRKTLKSDLGFAQDANLEFQLKGFSVWNDWAQIVAEPNAINYDRDIAVKVLDPFHDGITFSVKEDSGTPVRPPALKYVCPVTIANRVVSNSQTSGNFLAFDVSDHLHLILHIRVNWRVGSFDPHPSGEGQLLPIRHRPHLAESFSELSLN